jgi:hypothetical protein
MFWDDYKIIDLSISKKHLISIQEQLKDGCLFKMQRIMPGKIRILVKICPTDIRDEYYYKVTNDERRRIMRLIGIC